MLPRCFIVPLAALLFVTGCSGRNSTEAIASALRLALEAPATTGTQERSPDAVRRFYAGRDYRPAWVVEKDYDGVRRAIAVLKSAPSHGLMSDYGAQALEQQLAGFTSDNRAAQPAHLAALELEVSTNLLLLARDVAFGRVDPTQLQRSWKRSRPDVDLVAALDRSERDLPAFLASVQPSHPEYMVLSHALQDLLATGGSSSDDSRVAQLSANLERWRWMPDDLGPRHLLVNIPSFDLRAREDGHTVLTMPVVVGKKNGHETPVFSDVMERVVFSPYWNVPERIAENETAPAAAKDPTYLEKHGMEVFKRTKRGLEPVDSESVDWEEPAAVKQLVVRQKPGKLNALGGVKFLFPNEFDVYLHDTPSVSLFSRPSRAFSHGCVRVSQPETLAAYVLRDAPEWNDQSIAAAMTAGKERAVALKEKLPVHIVYFTAWAGDDGVVHYEKDIYGYDAKQITLSSAQEIE